MEDLKYVGSFQDTKQKKLGRCVCVWEGVEILEEWRDPLFPEEKRVLLHSIPDAETDFSELFLALQINPQVEGEGLLLKTTSLTFSNKINFSLLLFIILSLFLSQ